MNPQSMLQLHDIHLPAGPGWWPPAPGWWVLSAILLLLLGWAAFWLYRHYKKWRWQKQLMSEFNGYQSKARGMDDVTLVTEISRSLRQLALTLYPATDVANLSGNDWLAFLHQHSQQQDFFNEPARYLVELPYRKNTDKLTTAQRQQLMQLARQWAEDNLRGSV